MPQAPPSFLRIHRGPERANAVASASATSKQLAVSDTEMIDRLWDQFASATGWRLAPRPRRTGQEVALVPAVDAASCDDTGLEQHPGDGLPDAGALTNIAAVSKTAATALASATHEVVRNLHQSRETNRRDQVELAARACVIAAPDSRTGLAERIETILSDAVAACDVTAAIVYMLDDDTSELAARSVFGMSSKVLGKPARPLKGSRGDLEAMVRSVVTIDDLSAGPLDTWNPPVEASAAICASICVGDVPVGTLWLLCNQTKHFGDMHAAAARMAARSIGVELSIVDSASPLLASKTLDPDSAIELAAESDADTATSPGSETSADAPSGLEMRFDSPENMVTATESIGAEPPPAEDLETTGQSIAPEPSVTAERIGVDNIPAVHSHQTVTTVADVARWQIQTLPVGTMLAPGWRVDGMIESPHDFAIGWHLWDVLPDGSLAIAIAESWDQQIAGAMNATVARAAFASHAGYRHTPAQMISRVGDTLWQTTADQQLTSMLYLRVDPETGEGEYASAGQISAIIGSRYGYRPVTQGATDPLGSQIDMLSKQDSFRMMPGETFLAYTPGWNASPTTPTVIGSTLHEAMQKGHQHPLSVIRKALSTLPIDHEKGAATLMRV